MPLKENRQKHELKIKEKKTDVLDTYTCSVGFYGFSSTKGECDFHCPTTPPPSPTCPPNQPPPFFLSFIISTPLFFTTYSHPMRT